MNSSAGGGISLGGSQASNPSSLNSLTGSIMMGVNTESFKGFRNVFIGENAARDALNASDGVVLGYQAALFGAADSSVVLGSSAAGRASSSTSGSSVVIGAHAALTAGTVTSSVVVGRSAAATTGSITRAVLVGDALTMATSHCEGLVAIGTALTVGGSRPVAGLSQKIVAVCNNSTVGGENVVALGNGLLADPTTAHNVVLGNDSQCYGSSNIMLCNASSVGANSSNNIVVGTGTAVPDGVSDSTAVDVPSTTAISSSKIFLGEFLVWDKNVKSLTVKTPNDANKAIFLTEKHLDLYNGALSINDATRTLTIGIPARFSGTTTTIDHPSFPNGVTIAGASALSNVTASSITTVTADGKGPITGGSLNVADITGGACTLGAVNASSLSTTSLAGGRGGLTAGDADMFAVTAKSLSTEHSTGVRGTLVAGVCSVEQLTAAGEIRGTDITGTTLTASTGDVVVAKGSVVVSAGGVNVATGNVVVSAGDVSARKVTATGDATLGATLATSLTTKATAGNVRGPLVVGAATVASLDAGGGAIQCGSLTTGNAQDNTRGGLTAGDANLFAVTAKSLSTEHSPGVRGTLVAGACSVDEMTAANGIVGKDITGTSLTASTGDVTVTKGCVVVSAGNVNVATGNVVVSAGDVSARKVTATGDATLGATLATSLTTKATAGNVRGPLVVGAATVASLDASGAIQCGSLTTGDENRGGLTAGDANLFAVTAKSLSTEHSTGVKGALVAGICTLEQLTVADGIVGTDITGTSLAASTGDVTVSKGSVAVATGNVVVSKGSVVVSAGDVVVATGNVVVSGGDVVATGNVSAKNITATGDATLGATLATSLTTKTGTGNVRGPLDVGAATVASLDTGGAIRCGSLTTVTSAAGSEVETRGDLTAGAADLFALTAGSIAVPGGTVACATVSASGTVVVGALETIQTKINNVQVRGKITVGDIEASSIDAQSGKIIGGSTVVKDITAESLTTGIGTISGGNAAFREVTSYSNTFIPKTSNVPGDSKYWAAALVPTAGDPDAKLSFTATGGDQTGQSVTFKDSFSSMADAFYCSFAGTQELAVGRVVVSEGTYSDDDTDPDNTFIPVVSLSSSPESKAVVGVVHGYEGGDVVRRTRIGNIEFGRPKLSTDVRVLVRCSGMGPIAVCNEGGNVLVGDLLCTSTLTGVAKKQADQTAVKAFTCAKATGAVVFEDAAPDPTGNPVITTVGCVYKF
jgi:lipopolysaccharide export system protein LptA